MLDRPFEPLADRLADLAAVRRPDQLLNVGYGIEAVRPAFDRYVHSDEVRFTAACWMASAPVATRTVLRRRVPDFLGHGARQ